MGVVVAADAGLFDVVTIFGSGPELGVDPEVTVESAR